MARMTRRAFVAAAAALPAGCMADRYTQTASGVVTGRPVRAPAIGQSWRYSKIDVYTRKQVDTQIDNVTAVAQTVEIDSHTESKPAQAAGAGWLHKYFARPAAEGKPLPSEIQQPWGMILVDPHWSEVQVYEAPIPLWPLQLRAGWAAQFNTTYKVSELGDDLRWDQRMRAEEWETITVPAGRFKTLRYVNVINFKDSDLGRTDSMRHETLWFAPDVGRWVARESVGTYYLAQSVSDDRFNESSYRWELLEWT